MSYQPFTIHDAIRAVATRRWTVIAIFFATCFLIGLATILAPKTYKSEAKLFMRLGRENTSVDATVTLGEHPVVMLPQSREAEINSIVELIQSKQLYGEIVDLIGAERILDREWKEEPTEESNEESQGWDPVGDTLSYLAEVGVLNDLPRREKAIIKLQKKVEIEAFEKSNVLTVSFKSYSPELAKEVVEKLIELYQTQHVNLHRPPKAFEFLELETNRIEQELSEARVALENFKNETDILESAQQRTVLIERMAQLKASLLISESTKAALQTEVNELSAGLSQLSPTTTMSETTGAGNDAADGMRQELYRLEVLKEQLASRYTSDHPLMVQMESQVEEALTILEAAEAGRKELIVGPNKVYEEISVALKQKEALLAAEKSKSAKLAMQIDDIGKTLEQFTASEREFAKLDRKVEILEASYRKYYANLENVRIDTRMKQEEFSNIGIAQQATLNLKPYSPNKLVNLLAAIVLGTFGGISYAVLAEFLNPKLSANEIEKRLGLPVLMAVPDLEEDQLKVKSPKRSESLIGHQED